MAKNSKPKEVQKDSAVSQSDFDSFKEETTKTQNRMLDLLENLSKAPVETKTGLGQNAAASRNVLMANPGANAVVGTNDVYAGPTEKQMPPQYERIMWKHFDPADGFKGEMEFPSDEDTTRGAITFTVIVPAKFSNASEAHKKYYKEDRRLIVIRPESIVRDIDSWCSRVSKNLRYNKKMVTK